MRIVAILILLACCACDAQGRKFWDGVDYGVPQRQEGPSQW